MRLRANVVLVTGASTVALIAAACGSFVSEPTGDVAGTDAAADAPPSDATEADATPQEAAADGGSDADGASRIRCNASRPDDGCLVGAQYCCVSDNEPFAARHWYCADEADASACPQYYIHAPCDDGADCAALGFGSDVVCCANFDQPDGSAPFNFTRVECVARTACKGEANHWVLCDPTATDAGCGGGTACTSLGGGFAHCE